MNAYRQKDFSKGNNNAFLIDSSTLYNARGDTKKSANTLDPALASKRSSNKGTGGGDLKSRTVPKNSNEM